MSNSFDFANNDHRCEVVIPIILKIPIYIEPIVIEKKATCCEQKADYKKMSVQSKAEPVPLQHGIQQTQAATVPDTHRLNHGLLWKKLSQTVAKAWQTFSRAVRNLFVIRLSRRGQLPQ